MGCIELTLPSIEGVLLSHSSFLLPLSEQVLLVPAVEAFFAFLAIFETMAVVVVVPLYYFVLELIAPILVASSSFLLLSYFPSNVDLN